MKPALIIFQKNAVAGKVKTRLAASVGDTTALKIYKDLINITAKNCQKLQDDIDLHVFYSMETEDSDEWSSTNGEKHVQLQNDDLGKRMTDAFERLWNRGYRQLCIIGTDCPYLSEQIISEAFNSLNFTDVVIGPALDGGFYLLGINSLSTLTFNDITWSTQNVLKSYQYNLDKGGWSISLLPTLEDIDDEISFNRFKNQVNPLNYN